MSSLRFVDSYRPVILSASVLGLPLPWTLPETKGERIPYICKEIVILIFVLWKSICVVHSIFVNPYVDRMMSQATALATAQSIFIFYFYCVNWASIRKVSDAMEAMAEEIVGGSFQSRWFFADTFRSDARLFARFGILMISSTITSPALFCCTVLIQRYLSSVENRTMPVAVGCPFESQAGPGFFELFVLCQILGYVVVALWKIINELVVFRLIKILDTTCRFICKASEEIEIDNTTQLNEDTRNKIRELIKIHQIVIRLTNEMYKIYSPIVVVYYTTLLTFVVEYMYFFATVKVSLFQTCAMLMYFTITVVLFYVLCHLVDALTDEGEKVANAFYNIPWYNWNSKDRCILQLVICLANRPLRMTAYRVPTFNINRKAFQTFCVNIVSAYMTLRTLKIRE